PPVVVMQPDADLGLGQHAAPRVIEAAVPAPEDREIALVDQNPAPARGVGSPRPESPDRGARA
ncbi:MAG: hypothetical protein RIR70_1274, partial [Pseudomonadota bacterium]